MQILKIFQKKSSLIITLLILVLAATLRLVKLGEVPHGMTWDETAIAYNGYAMATAHRDEWLHKLPVSFKSFGDYKAPLAIYLNGVFTYLGGMKLWVVRLPFALAGVVAVWQMMVLTKRLLQLTFKIESAMATKLSWVAGIILALSPWHLHFSRTGFESGLSLTLLLVAVNSALIFLSANKKTFWYWVAPALSLGSAVMAGYAYHSAKLVMPFLFLALFIAFGKKWFTQQKWKPILLGIIFALILISPLIYDSIWGNGLERAGTLLFFQTSDSGQILKTFATQLGAHLSPQFLIRGQVTTLRHGSGAWGVFLAPTFILVLLGLVFGWFKKSKKYYLLSLLWILIGLMPAALGIDGVPHQNRALLALPGFILLAVLGMYLVLEIIRDSKLNQKVIGSHGEKNILLQSFVMSWLVLEIIFGASYLQYYYTQFAAQSATAFQDGYLEAFEYVATKEKEINKILFTDEYGQPYIYALVVRKTNPIWYHGGSLIKYEFTDWIHMGDLDRENALVVAGQRVGQELPIEKAQHVVYGSDGQVRFKIYDTREIK